MRGLHAEPRFAAYVASRAIDAVEYRMELASEDYGDEAIDADAAMDAEARQQLAHLDALAPYATKLSHARFGLPAHEQERLLAALRDMVTVPTPTPSTCQD